MSLSDDDILIHDFYPELYENVRAETVLHLLVTNPWCINESTIQSDFEQFAISQKYAKEEEVVLISLNDAYRHSEFLKNKLMFDKGYVSCASLVTSRRHKDELIWDHQVFDFIDATSEDFTKIILDQ